MVVPKSRKGERVAKLISKSGLSIHESIDTTSPLFFDIFDLEDRLRNRLTGLDLNYPLRTRAKYSKSYVAEAMGYVVPKSFPKTRPRFPGQNLDVYVQKANNLQIWNEEVDPQRRYVLIRVNDDAVITDVRVVTGEAVALLDRTGTLTQKYQASRRTPFTGSKLVSAADTVRFKDILQPVSVVKPAKLANPTSRPEAGHVVAITPLFESLVSLVGTRLAYGRLDQERSRGTSLHRLACSALGYPTYADTGQFPDILNQALEVKLQTSRTIDLGLVVPDSQLPAQEVGEGIRHCDVRYAVFYAARSGDYGLTITEVVVATGEDFFVEFQRFEGNIKNKKIQIPLPSDFFR